MKKIIVLVGVIIYLVNCTSSKRSTTNLSDSYLPTQKELTVAQKINSSITLADLKNGHAIYFNQCIECHKAYDIPKFSERKWKHEIDDMSPKANLTDAQIILLSNYVLSFREANTVVVK